MLKQKEFNKLMKRLKKVIDVKENNNLNCLSVADYIEKYKPKTEMRESKNGTKLIKVYFADGSVKEYQLNKIKSCTVLIDSRKELTRYLDKLQSKRIEDELQNEYGFHSLL